MEKCSGRANGSDLRSLRRATSGAAGVVDVTGVRADCARGKTFRAWIGRRQGSALSPHQGPRGAPGDAQKAAGERPRHRRGRRGSRQRAPRRIRRKAEEAPRRRRGRHLRLGDVCAGIAVDSLVTARVGLLRDQRPGSQGRPALGQLRWRDRESGDGPCPHPRHVPRCEWPRRNSRILR